MATRLRVSDEQSLVIPLDKAELLFHKKTAIFIDARSRTEYASGHIRGALSLSWQDVDHAYVESAALLDDNENIVTYCDGEACDLSHELALFLKEMGYENVYVLSNGWTEWTNAGLPTEVEN
jgi:rhodanese-related sulfurtransferase